MSDQNAEEPQKQSGAPQDRGSRPTTVLLPPGTITGGSFFTGVPAFIVSGFKNDFRLKSNAGVVVQVASLQIPLGIASIWAKLYVGASQEDSARTLIFRLEAEDDFDQTVVTHDPITPFVSVALNVAHVFMSGGFATLTAEFSGQGGETTLNHIRVTAMSGVGLINARLS